MLSAHSSILKKIKKNAYTAHIYIRFPTRFQQEVGFNRQLQLSILMIQQF